MDKITTFCEECRDDVVYNVTELIKQSVLKEETYKYKGKEAVCAQCGSEVYVAEIEDYNLKALYDAYRNKDSVIS